MFVLFEDKIFNHKFVILAEDINSKVYKPEITNEAINNSVYVRR